MLRLAGERQAQTLADDLVVVGDEAGDRLVYVERSRLGIPRRAVGAALRLPVSAAGRKSLVSITPAGDLDRINRLCKQLARRHTSAPCGPRRPARGAARRAAARAEPVAVDRPRARAAGAHAGLQQRAATPRSSAAGSASGAPSSGAHGSTRRAYSASHRTTLPMPAATLWSSSTSPIGARAARARPRALDGQRRCCGSSSSRSGPSGRRAGWRASRRAVEQLEHRPAELHRREPAGAQRRATRPRGCARQRLRRRGRRARRRSCAGASGGCGRPRSAAAGACRGARRTRGRGRRARRRARGGACAARRARGDALDRRAARGAAPRAASVWPSGRASASRAGVRRRGPAAKPAAVKAAAAGGAGRRLAVDALELQRPRAAFECRGVRGRPRRRASPSLGERLQREQRACRRARRRRAARRCAARRSRRLRARRGRRPARASAARCRTGWPDRSPPARRAVASAAGSRSSRSRSIAPGRACCAPPRPSTR